MLLCIQEEPMVLATRKLVLEKAGFSVLSVTEPREALRLLAAETIHAVVLDACSEELQGETIAAMMKRLKPSVKILMLSPELFAIERDAAVDAFVTTSGGPQEMLDKLESLLSQSQANGS